MRRDRLTRWLTGSSPISGLVSGIQVGINPGGASVPVRQFPTSGAGWASAFPTVPTPTNLWLFQEASSPILDKIGTDNLAQNQALLYSQAGDPEPSDAPRRSLEFDTTASAEFTSTAGTGVGDISALAGWSLYVRFRAPDNGATARAIVSKGGGGVPRWVLQLNNGGALAFDLRDGTTTFTRASAGTYDDGNYHDVLIVYDQANALFRLITETETLSLASTLFLGVTSLTVFRFGGGGAGLSVLAGTRVSYAALWPTTAITAANLVTIRTPQ